MPQYFENINLEKEIKEKCLIEGDFLLSSGVRSSYYFDKYMFESDPQLLHNVAIAMTRHMPNNWHDMDFVAGLEMGGISIATVISQYLNIPLLQVRKKKKKYGTAKCVEGPDFSGKRVAIVEDVVTSGKAVIQGCKDLRAGGAIVDQVHCVILRDQKGQKNIDKMQLKLYNILDFSIMENNNESQP